MEKQEKTFRECTLQYLEKAFSLVELKTLPSLESWLDAPYDLSEFERHELIQLREILDFNVHHWNEQELYGQFIGPIFSNVNFSSMQFNHFVQREIEGEIDGIKLFGRPDGMIASGRREPEQPFFAFQEYKRLLDPNGDPAGQALAAMLVGQSLSDRAEPIYGCYVVGPNWRFMVLEGRQYAISYDYSGITDDVSDIFRILKNLKEIVAERTANL